MAPHFQHGIPTVPVGCPRIAQHNPIHSVLSWHCLNKSRSGTLALIGERVDAPIFAGRSASTLATGRVRAECLWLTK
jgi:hypothetical protein